MKSFTKFFYEAYSDMGKLSPEQLARGQRLDPEEHDNFKQVDGRVFHKIISQIINNDKFRCSTNAKYCKHLIDNITVYDLKDYQTMKCFIGKNNSSGFAIKGGDELVSVFSSLEPSGNAVVKEAIKQGARRLDCFAEQDKGGNIMNIGLPKLYGNHGFKIDEGMTTGKDPRVPYTIVRGVSYFVNENEEVDLTNPKVVVFMSL